jgi:Esterase PHB depolymerase
MFSYLPPDLAPGAPLVVVLHGCKQKAVTFAREAGWLALADRSRPLDRGLGNNPTDRDAYIRYNLNR